MGPVTGCSRPDSTRGIGSNTTIEKPGGMVVSFAHISMPLGNFVVVIPTRSSLT